MTRHNYVIKILLRMFNLESRELIATICLKDGEEHQRMFWHRQCCTRSLMSSIWPMLT